MARFVSRGGRFFIEYPEGPDREIYLRLDPAQGDNVLDLCVVDENGENEAPYFRTKGVDGGQRISGQPLTTSSPMVVTDGNGHITNG